VYFLGLAYFRNVYKLLQNGFVDGKNDSNRCLEEGLPKLGNLKPQAETRVRHELARLFNPFLVKKCYTFSGNTFHVQNAIIKLMNVTSCKEID
jgi:hypothetical protein